jgi:glycosyltransferase involved in cell wall biosynthesis
MRISVITVCYNSESTILDCLDSVAQQDHLDVQHIIVDGKSNDNTVSIIQNFIRTRRKQINLISEPDNGIYDAMNKGIKLSDGDVVGFLNADDFFSTPYSLSKINQAFRNTNADGCYGDLEIVSPRDHTAVIRRWIGGQMPASKMRAGWHPAHPTFYIRRDLLSGGQGFRLKYKIAADYELMLRKVMVDRLNLTYINEPLVKMRAGGASNGTIFNIIRANRECYAAWIDNDLGPNPFVIPLKIFWKVRQRILGAMS